MIEKIALSAAMVHNELVADLHIEYFVEHRDIAKAVKRLYQEQKTVSPNFVKIKIGETEELKDILLVYPTADEGREAIRDLRLAFEKRSFTEAIVELGKMNERHPIETSMKIFSDRINSIREVSDRKIFQAEELISPLLAQMSEARKTGAWQPLFGIHSVDELIKGRSPGEVLIVLAPPKEGKSAAATRMIESAIENDYGLFLSSGEMTEVDTMIRPIASMSGHKTSELEDGSVISDDKFLQALDKLKDKKIFVSNRGLSIPYMQEEVTTYKSLYGVDLFLYDQLNLFDEVIQDKGWTAYQQVVASARRIANQQHVTIVLFHQINKEALVKPAFRGNVYSARGGQASLMQSTKVIILHRPEAHNLVQFEDGPFRGIRASGLMEIFVGLGNRLRLGSSMVRFIGEQQTIAPLDPGTTFEGINLDEPFYYGASSKIDDKPIFTFEDEGEKADDLPF